MCKHTQVVGTTGILKAFRPSLAESIAPYCLGTMLAGCSLFFWRLTAAKANFEAKNAHH